MPQDSQAGFNAFTCPSTDPHRVARHSASMASGGALGMARLVSFKGSIVLKALRWQQNYSSWSIAALGCDPGCRLRKEVVVRRQLLTQSRRLNRPANPSPPVEQVPALVR
jgi:hypothetical protein